MNTIKFIFIALLVAGISISCGNSNNRPTKEKQQSSYDEKKGAGRIEFQKEIHNFGSLKVGEVVAFTFVFKNVGENPFAITKTENSCGCIEIQYDKSQIIPEQESGIQVVFNSAGEWGNDIKTIKIFTSSGEEKELTITAYVENEDFNNLLNTEK